MEPILQILPPKTNQSRSHKFDKLNKHLFKPDFIYVIYGPCNSGKSVTLNHMITNKNFYKGVFKKVVIISPTILYDPSLRDLNNNDDILKITSGLDNMDEIMETIVELRQQDMMDGNTGHMLLVFDDCLQYIHHNGFIAGWIPTFRHYSMSIIFTTQGFKKLPPIVRALASGYLLFRTNNKKERVEITDELAENFPNFQELYARVTMKKYNFLFLDLKNCRMYENFTTLLYDSDNNVDLNSKLINDIAKLMKDNVELKTFANNDHVLSVAKKHLTDHEYLKLLFYSLKSKYK